MRFMDAVKKCLGNYVTFSGRAQRAEYWWFVLFVVLVSIVTAIFDSFLFGVDPETGEIKRFLVGPKECEITGAAWSADRTTMFVSIQHPGEKGDSVWPNGGVPRSSVIAISRDDGEMIG